MARQPQGHEVACSSITPNNLDSLTKEHRRLGFHEGIEAAAALVTELGRKLTLVHPSGVMVSDSAHAIRNLTPEGVVEPGLRPLKED